MKLVKNFSFVILVAILLSIFSISKGQDGGRYVSFRVVDEISGNPVELAHVINVTKKDATISDLLGYFKIYLGVGDTITVSSLGYFKKEIFNWGQYKDDSLFYTLKLKPRSYELKEVKFTWFSDSDSFLKGFLNLRVPLTKEERDLERIGEYFNRTIRRLDLKNLPQSTSGATFGIDWLAKQNMALNERLEKEKRQRAIERKFSAGMVEALTGLKGNEVFWFMAYCEFTDDYILKSSDYEIRLRIINKFKVYNQDKELKDKK